VFLGGYLAVPNGVGRQSIRQHIIKAGSRIETSGKLVAHE